MPNTPGLLTSLSAKYTRIIDKMRKKLQIVTFSLNLQNDYFFTTFSLFLIPLSVSNSEQLRDLSLILGNYVNYRQNAEKPLLRMGPAVINKPGNINKSWM